MMKTDGGHNVAQHKRMDRNGSFCENTGRNSYVFHLKAPLFNSIAKSRNESWTAGKLFPDVYQRLIAALEDRSTGDFVHPIYGTRTCKVGPFDDTLNPGTRGGPEVSFTLIETVDGDQVSLVQESAVSVGQAAAFEVDAAVAKIIQKPDTGTPGGISLTDFIKSIGSIADQVDLVKQQIGGQINRVISAVTGLGQKFGATPGFSDQTQRLISSLHAQKATLLQKDKATRDYLVAKPSTVASIAKRTGQTVKDLLTLNPLLAAVPVVPAEIVVRIYAS